MDVHNCYASVVELQLMQGDLIQGRAILLHENAIGNLHLGCLGGQSIWAVGSSIASCSGDFLWAYQFAIWLQFGSGALLQGQV